MTVEVYQIETAAVTNQFEDQAVTQIEVASVFSQFTEQSITQIEVVMVLGDLIASGSSRTIVMML